jgi:Pyridoxamine 5'-phosphate oxidase
MTRWQQFTEQAPELAAYVTERFAAHQHKVMATLRADGSPRLCGTEVEIVAGDLWLGGMPGNRRFADLRRDPRVAVHSGSDEPAGWSGDARVGGTAVEASDDASLQRYRAAVGKVPPGPFELFRVELTEAVAVRLDDEHLLIESWRPGDGVRRVVRR